MQPHNQQIARHGSGHTYDLEVSRGVNKEHAPLNSTICRPEPAVGIGCICKC